MPSLLASSFIYYYDFLLFKLMFYCLCNKCILTDLTCSNINVIISREKQEKNETVVNDDRLKHIDSKMVELIESEIIDKGTPVGKWFVNVLKKHSIFSSIRYRCLYKIFNN